MSIEPGFELKNKVAELSALLLDKHPRMPLLLREIHQALSAQPEQVTLMSEQEIAIIVSGLKVQTATEFAASATKAPKSVTAKIKALGVDAF